MELSRHERRELARISSDVWCPNCGEAHGGALFRTETDVLHCGCYYGGGEHAEMTLHNDPFERRLPTGAA